MVARSLSAFLLVQIPAESQVRLKAGSEPKLSQKAQQVVYGSCWLVDMPSLHACSACGSEAYKSRGKLFFELNPALSLLILFSAECPQSFFISVLHLALNSEFPK